MLLLLYEFWGRIVGPGSADLLHTDYNHFMIEGFVCPIEPGAPLRILQCKLDQEDPITETRAPPGARPERVAHWVLL